MERLVLRFLTLWPAQRHAKVLIDRATEASAVRCDDLFQEQQSQRWVFVRALGIEGIGVIE
jgi:hypothetical protein